MINEIKNLRKELHKYPEVSGLESNTASLIKSFIEKHNPTQILDKIGGHGIAAIYQFSNDGPSIAIRCELDALPIGEKNQFAHRSTNDGVSHKCGHDGHMAIVAGLIFWIKERAFKSGKIILLFQPAEESGKGAYEVLEDKRFIQLNIDYIFALHNIPGKTLHSIITMNKCFSAEVQSFKIQLSGRESHAAEPENGINPATTISEIITSLSVLNVEDINDDHFANLTPVHITMGQKSYGISPAKGELHYTIRTLNTNKLQILKSEIESNTERICQHHKVTFEFNWFEYFPASLNDSHCNKLVIEAAKELNFKLVETAIPFKFGEDFGWFSQKYKAVMFGLGAGKNTPPLHEATYDFPEEIIETGISMFKTIISKIFKSHLTYTRRT